MRNLPHRHNNNGVGMIKGLFAAGVLCVAASAVAAPVYTCQHGGQTVYTSEPSGNCQEGSLPGISRYDGGGYKLASTAPRKQKSAKKAAKSSSRKSTQKKTAKKSATPKSAKKTTQKSSKGQGYQGFPAIPRKEVK